MREENVEIWYVIQWLCNSESLQPGKRVKDSGFIGGWANRETLTHRDYSNFPRSLHSRRMYIRYTESGIWYNGISHIHLPVIPWIFVRARADMWVSRCETRGIACVMYDCAINTKNRKWSTSFAEAWSFL